MKRWTLAVAAALLLVTVTSGCGKDKKSDSVADATTTTAARSVGTNPASTGTGENSHACDLLTPADVTAALSITVGEGTSGGSDDISTCNFRTADHNTNINVVRYEQGSDLLTGIRQGDPNAKTITGIGDDAVEQQAVGKIATTLGSIGISISVTAAPEASALESLAKAAVGHFNNP
jgi:hypothetical protein